MNDIDRARLDLSKALEGYLVAMNAADAPTMIEAAFVVIADDSDGQSTPETFVCATRTFAGSTITDAMTLFKHGHHMAHLQAHERG